MFDSDSTVPSFDAVVIGAGFAGLRAAVDLQRAGLHTALLEARDRVGGRSRPGMLAGRVVDTGGQWVGHGHAQLTRLAADAGVPLLSQERPGAKLLQIGDRLHRYSGLIPPASPVALIEMQILLWRLRLMQRQVPPDAPWTATRAAQLDALTVADWQRRWLRSDRSRMLFDAAVRAVLCTEASNLSMLGFLHYLGSSGSFDALLAVRDGAQAQTVGGGMHALATHLAQQLMPGTLKLSTAVLAIEQRSNDVRIRLDGDRCLQARRVIVAMAPRMAGDIAMAPACAERSALAHGMPMGSVIKCVIAYARPFWRDAGLNGEFVGDRALLSPVFDASPADGSHGALVGFIDGANARHWSKATPEARRAAVLASLVGAFGPQAAAPIDYLDHDWITDPWSRGCYVGVPTPGILSRHGPALAAPSGRIHWAGTETAGRWCGYIEGALLSGARAASEVRTALAQ